MMNNHHGRVIAFLKTCRVPKGDVSREITHTLIDGGSFCVPASKVDDFHEILANDIRDGTVPALSERRSPLCFPMFADLDLRVRAPVLSDDAVVRIAAIINHQMHRFYEDAPDLKLVVCTKDSADPVACDAAGLHKHGVHLHWPRLLVDVERALRMRTAAVVALEREDWTDALGDASVDWEETVDASVYSGGLRPVGAIKAKKCTTCRSKADDELCEVCGKLRYVYDRTSYGLRTVLVGGEVDAEATRSLRANAVRLVKNTTVRAPEGTALTEGFRVFVGCPALPAAKKRKGQQGGGLPAGVESRYKKRPPVTDSAILDVMRRQLVKHSPHYEKSRMTVLADNSANPTSYRVALTGEGGNFCLNKGGDHSNQHVYMVVERKDNDFVSRMRCFSRKPVPQPLSRTMCKDFCSYHRNLSAADANTCHLRVDASAHAKRRKK